MLRVVLTVLLVAVVAQAIVPIPDDLPAEAKAEIAAYLQYAKNPDPRDVDFFNILEIPTGFAASMMCGGVFIAGLPEDKVLEEDVDIARYVTKTTVDYTAKTVTSTFLNGAAPYKAVWREGVGCTLVAGITEEELRAQDLGNQSPPVVNVSREWPLGDYVDPTIPSEIDINRLRAAVNEDFANEVYNTRAIVVVYKGKIVLEQYAPDITKETALIGWSMTKSTTSAIIGILTGQGRLTVEQQAPVPEWSGRLDNRGNITIKNLLHMSSGLRWNEALNVIQCLFTAFGDCAAYAAERELRDTPNTVWEYSTGTSTILARVATENRNARLNNFELYKTELFNKLQMRSATIEYHYPGYPLGGSNLYASARDWARFGLLYQRNGIWVDGTSILPSGWVDFTCTPSPTSSEYGAQFWLKTSPAPDICSANGLRSQNVFTIRSKELVIARLAMPNLIRSAAFDEDKFLNSIVPCFP